MIDLIAMALSCDATRVVSFMLDDSRSDFSYNFLTSRLFTATGSTATSNPLQTNPVSGRELEPSGATAGRRSRSGTWRR